MDNVCLNCGEPIYNLCGTPTDLAKAIRIEAQEQILDDLYDSEINGDYHLKITLTVLEVRRLIERLTLSDLEVVLDAEIAGLQEDIRRVVTYSSEAQKIIAAKKERITKLEECKR